MGSYRGGGGGGGGGIEWMARVRFIKWRNWRRGISWRDVGNSKVLRGIWSVSVFKGGTMVFEGSVVVVFFLFCSFLFGMGRVL